MDDSRLDYAAWLGTSEGARGHYVLWPLADTAAVRSGRLTHSLRSDYDGVVGIIPVSPGEYNHEGIIDLHADEFTNAYSWCVEQVESGNRRMPTSRPGIPWGSSWTARAFIDCFNPDNRYSVTERCRRTGLPCPVTYSGQRSAETAPSVFRSVERRCAV